MEQKTPRSVKVTHLPQAEVEIESELSADEIKKHRAGALRHLNEETNIPGFRPGHIPEKILVERIGELSILEKAVRHALGDVYPEILESEKIDAIGRPEISLTKLVPGQPATFKIKTAVAPTVDLPDYRGLAKKVPADNDAEPEISEKELTDAIGRIRSQFAQTEKEGEKTTATADTPLSDEEVKRWGDFADVSDFKTKLTAAMRDDKQRERKEKRRIAIADKILDQTSVELPRILVEHEMDTLMARLEADLKTMGGSIAEYAKNIKKTETEVRENMRPAAEKKAKLQLVLNEIAKVEKIKIKTEDLEKELAHLRAHHPDAHEESLRIYAVSMLGNEKVFEFLEQVQ